MVMNGQLAWLEIYKDWQALRGVYATEQQSLDQCMADFLAAGEHPPSRQMLEKVADLRHQLAEKRLAVDAFIAAHASENTPAFSSLPGPDASLDKR